MSSFGPVLESAFAGAAILRSVGSEVAATAASGQGS